MYLERLELHNFRCFETLDIDFHKQLTVIVGKNGSGKTTILEAAAIAAGSLFAGLDRIPAKGIDKETDPLRKAYVMGVTDDVQQQFPVEITAYGRIDDTDQENLVWKRAITRAGGTTTTKEARQLMDRSYKYQSLLSKGDPDLQLPVIAYYGTGRLWDYHRQKQKDIFTFNTRTNGYINSLDGTANVKLMIEWFRNMTISKYQRQEENLGSIPELDAVYAAMESCLQKLSEYSDIKIRYNMNTNELDVYYSNTNGERMRIPLNQLSDGYKGMISLAADIAYRMAALNPQLGIQVLEKSGGLVLIDEIDLHLHPAWQQRVLDNLTEIFPRVQFIVSTHAPAVIHSVRTENLRILNGNQVNQVYGQVYGKDIQSVLNEIMDAKERPEKVTGLFDRFYQLLEENKLDEAEKVLDELDVLREYHDPEVAGCRVKLKLEKIRGTKQ